MWRTLLIPLILPFFAGQQLNAACPCMIRFGVCDEAKQADAIFIGTVESVAPTFLDPYSQAKATASTTNAEAARLQKDPSPEALEKLKNIYLDMFVGFPDFARAQIAEALTPQDLQTAFESVQQEGRVAKFRVRTLYKLESDDDDKKPDPTKNAAKDTDKDDQKPEFMDIWSGSGECGIDFQAGETYLVYAVQDEDSGKLQTSVCMRTRRLSEENGDLGFLYFLENAEKESTRLEGFVSTSFTDQSLPLYADGVTAPSPGAIIELDSGAGVRYTQSDGEGRFFFDGLKAGDYRLSLLAPGFPRAPRTVVLSRGFHAAEAACARQIFILPPPSRSSTSLPSSAAPKAGH